MYILHVVPDDVVFEWLLNKPSTILDYSFIAHNYDHRGLRFSFRTYLNRSPSRAVQLRHFCVMGRSQLQDLSHERRKRIKDGEKR